MKKKKKPMASMLLSARIASSSASEGGDARVVDAVGPPNVDEAKQERTNDYDRCKDDAERKSRSQNRAEQRLVERKKSHEAEIDRDHRKAQGDRHAEAPISQVTRISFVFGFSSPDICAHFISPHVPGRRTVTIRRRVGNRES